MATTGCSEWVRMRVDLYSDAKVCIMTDVLMDPRGNLGKYVDQYTQCGMHVTRNVMRNAVVGTLVSVWGRFRHMGDRRGSDLFVAQAAIWTVDDVANMDGFGEAMVRVGWLVDNDEGLLFPNFFEEFNDSYYEKNSEHRRKNAERQRKFRENSNALRNAKVTQDNALRNDEKALRKDVDKDKDNRKEKRENPIRDVILPILPEEFSSLQPTLEDWLQYKAERKEGYKPTGLKALIGRITNLAQERGAKTVEDKIRTAMASGWKGWDHESQSGSSSNGHADIPF